jgi:hypothetical protein
LSAPPTKTRPSEASIIVAGEGSRVSQAVRPVLAASAATRPSSSAT